MPQSSIRLDADLTFCSTSSDGSPGVAGTVTAHGTTINVDVAAPVTGASKSTKRMVRHLASSLAQRQLRLVINGPGGMVVALGDVRTLRWQRLLTRSPHIRLGHLRDVRRMLSAAPTAARRDRGASLVSIPPPTMFPLFPTVSTLGPRPVTTTHDPRGGGMPRLIFASSPWPQAGEVRRVEYLTKSRTTFGSASDCDVVIEGLEPLHAVIERTDEDEYVLTHLAASGQSTIAGIPAKRSLLRTSSRVSLGATNLTYFREEYADHGRPYGGRLGGEIGYQRPQATPRPRARDAVGKPRTNRDPGRYFQ